MNEILIYIKGNWFQIIIDLIATLNIITAGAKVMGWNKIADECQKIESAIAAMVGAALNKNKVIQNGGVNEKVSTVGSDVVNGAGSASTSG